MSSEFLIEARNLKKHFPLSGGAALRAVDGISIGVRRGGTLGLVGESGCGKSTAGRALLGMYEPTAGEIFWDGKNLRDMTKAEKRRFVREGQMIFQDPYSSLNPRMTVADIVGEGIDIHGLYRGRARVDRINELLSMVGLPTEHGNRFPHEFSGGQRQRIGIARSLAVEPSFIVCDEPVSALDVSIQSQIINLLTSLRDRLSLTYLFISHDLGIVKYICERVAVMYLGVVVETASGDSLYGSPKHPYTRALMSAIPIADPKFERSRERVMLNGDAPSPAQAYAGCRFAPRCPEAMPVCRESEPELRQSSGHYVACWKELMP